ncbi:MAG: hypothetical protein JW934_11120 [Anaerolineae bacterium]|nr:hypothetical protein [Anaerolineae bacterium]
MGEHNDELGRIVDTFWQKADRAEAQDDAEDARAWMEAIVELDAANLEAWLRLAELIPDAQERMQCYVHVLEVDPRNVGAREGIRKTRRELR